MVIFFGAFLGLGGGRERPEDLDDEAAWEPLVGGGRENVDFLAGPGSLLDRGALEGAVEVCWVVSLSLPLSLSLP